MVKIIIPPFYEINKDNRILVQWHKFMPKKIFYLEHMFIIFYYLCERKINVQPKKKIYMASGDRTGPWGQGSRTGRGLGYCEGYDSPGFTKGPGGYGAGYGRGFRRGYGPGRGYGRRMGGGAGWGFLGSAMNEFLNYWAGGRPYQSKEEELESLRTQSKDLDNARKNIQNRIDEIEGKEK